MGTRVRDIERAFTMNTAPAVAPHPMAAIFANCAPGNRIFTHDAALTNTNMYPQYAAMSNTGAETTCCAVLQLLSAVHTNADSRHQKQKPRHANPAGDSGVNSPRVA